MGNKIEKGNNINQRNKNKINNAKLRQKDGIYSEDNIFENYESKRFNLK